MNKTQFWGIIEDAKESCGNNLEAYERHIKSKLETMSPEDIKEFQYIFKTYVKLADYYGLWFAAKIMAGYCSDDGFIDFRCWLISQGKYTYLNALRNPDSLADISLDHRNCQFETLLYVGCNVYEDLTGKNIYENWDEDHAIELYDEFVNDINYDIGIEYPYRWNEIALYLPNLCDKYISYGQLGKAIMEYNDPWNANSEKIIQARKCYIPKIRDRSEI